MKSANENFKKCAQKYHMYTMSYIVALIEKEYIFSSFFFVFSKENDTFIFLVKRVEFNMYIHT